MKRDFLSMESWGQEQCLALLDLADRVKRGEIPGGLEKKIMAMVFMDPSLRTRASFEAAMFLHGGHGIVLEPGKGSWSLETEPGAVMDGTTVEHIKDAARVLGRYADVLGVRTFPRPGKWDQVRQDLVIRRFAEYCEKPIINLESTRRHPCQGLADAMTLREKFGGDPRGKRFVLLWAWHPKALPTAVPASAAISAAMLGMEVVIARPDGYELDPEDTALVRQLARDNGSMIHINNDPDEALVGADAVYVKSWGSVKHYDHPEEEAAMRAGLRDWRLTGSRLKSTRGGKGIVMHCLPVRRNVELDDEIIDGPTSVVVDQAENRLHAQRALLLELLGARTS
jgi:N-acetylornithine carbamoyltransferase